MTDRDIRERDILVASNEYAYVQDLTKGDIVLYVGPTKISLSNTERLVDFRGERFLPVRAEEPAAGAASGVCPFVAAASSQYIILENPPKDTSAKPVKGSNSAIELLVGRKVVVPGPASFPLWPGQKAKVVDGHALREDEYLVVRVYERVTEEDRPIGSEVIVRGADVSFYVPRTGLEVVPNPRGGYVREAHRLKKGMGLHLRVIKTFDAGEDDQVPPGRYEAGQDLFLTDREGYFFPTESLEVVCEIAAVPLAEREGLYARDLATGRVDTIVGPVNYLADPTRVELVQRDLDEEIAGLYGVADPRPDRALSVYVPSGFAVLVTARNKREVVRGPQTRTLCFDEDLEVLELSTGKPKSQERTLRTCFLQVDGNKVSDVLRLETADHNPIEITVSYRVSFVTRSGEAERWFAVKDYVGLLCDHAGSLLRAAARATPLEAFYQNGTQLLRAAVLGEKHGAEPRPGRLFEENGMWVYDLEVLGIRILDAEVQALLFDAQRNAIVAEVHRRSEMLRLDAERLKEEVNRAVHEARAGTLAVEHALEARQRELSMARAETEVAVEQQKRVGRARVDAEAVGIAAEARARAAERDAELDQRALAARTAAFKEQMGAMHPELVATLKTLGHQKLAAELSRNVSPLAILGGESVSDVVARLLGSLPVGAEGTVEKVLPPKRKAG